MNKNRRINAVEDRKSVVEIPRPTTEFYGALKNTPSREVDAAHCSRNVNLIDFRKFKKVRPGTAQFSATQYPGTAFSARLDHAKSGVVVIVDGATVRVVDKTLTTYTTVLNIEDVSPTGSSTLEEDGDDAILFNTNGIWRVVLSDNFYWMYRINGSNIETLITDDAETAAKVYGYRYLLSRVYLSLNEDRDDGTAELLFESATNTRTGSKDYGEVFFNNAIGADLSQNHIIGTLTLEDDDYLSTHFGLYRSKNIGENSGGVSPGIKGVGNWYDQVIWVDDVPVARAWTVTIAGNTVTKTAGDNDFEYGDVGCTLYDSAGNSGVIDSWTNANVVVLQGGHTLGAGPLAVALGNGRVMTASQTATTITRTAGDTFDSTDAGKLYFFADGSYVRISSYTDANNVEATVSQTKASQAGTIKPIAGNFSRKYNDTLLDSGDGTSRENLQDRIDARWDLYIPRRFFSPMPNGNTGTIESGFMVVADRDETEYNYCQLEKRYSMGYYREDHQTEKVDSKIKAIKKFSGIAAIFSVRNTRVLNLTSSQNVGNTVVGQNVFKLPESTVADPSVGINFWQSIRYKSKGLMIAVTSEPAVRYFDGYSWSAQNYAIDYKTGDNAVQDIIDQIVPGSSLVAHYSEQDGYILWVQIWQRAGDNVVFNVGGTQSEDNIWVNVGGTAIDEDDIVNNVGIGAA